MRLNLAFFSNSISRINSITGAARSATILVPFTLAALVGCFKGGDVGLTGETGSETSTGTTGPICEVGTLDCPCTGGNGCDQGLECNNGICQEIVPECGDGVVEGDEQCDDANADNTDACTELCMPPSCSDGIVSGPEIATDCGLAACGVACDFGEPCMIANDCIFPVCEDDGDGGLSCQRPRTCNEYLMFTPNATDGIITIDPDRAVGSIPEFDVFCEMDRSDGGWTLVFVASDDGTNTWTWNNRGKMGNEPAEIGSVDEINRDFMSRAYHTLNTRDLLFIHQPSDVWVAYADVSMGGQSLGDIVASYMEPICDPQLSGNGFEKTDGTLSLSGQLCDTDLYFNLGDHELYGMDPTSCTELGSGSNTASYGPVWSANKNSGCPFDDPAEFALGPHGPCGACPNNFPSTEFNYLGYGNALNLNMGTQGAAENYMQIYVR